jgi:hypothetical protein
MWLGVLYFGVAAMLAQIHLSEIEFGPRHAARLARHHHVLDHTGDAPWAYRVLMPHLAEATAIPLRPLLGQPAVEIAYGWWQFWATFGLLCLFHRWLRTWLEPAWATSGTLLAAAMHPATYQFHWFQPDSPVDLLVWTAAGVLTVAGRDAWLFPLIAVGALNRETAVFVVAIYAALRWGREPALQTATRTVGLLACWGLPFAAVRWWVGARPWAVDLDDHWLSNYRLEWVAIAVAFLAPLLVLPWVGFARRPIELRRLAIVLLVAYLPLQVVFGRIREVRLLLPLALALVPLAMLTLREATLERDRE